MRRKGGLFPTAVAVTAAAGIALAGAIVVRHAAATDYWFMPGELGHQRVSRGPSLNAPKTVPRAYSVASDTASGAEDGFQTRSIGLLPGPEQEWGRRNRVTPPVNFMHALDRVFPRELFKTHPEFFPLVNGARYEPPKGSYYWNPDLGRPDVGAYAGQQAIRFFAGHPGESSFSLGVNDGLVFGESPEMLALLHRATPKAESTVGSAAGWYRGRPDYSPLVFTFMNRAAAELSRTAPDKYLGCLAYYWCENAPPFAVDRHIIPFLTADRSQSYRREFERDEFDLQNRWAKAMGAGRSSDPQLSILNAQPVRIGLYDYLDGYGFLVPRVPIHAFARHLRHAFDAGFTDYYGESSRNWGLDGPLPWVIAQLLQDPHADVEALLDLYYQNYFQSASKPMRRFFERCEEQWMRQEGPSYWLKYYRNEAQVELFPSAVCQELRGLLDAATAAAESDLVRARVALVSDAFGVTERFVAFQQCRVGLTNDALRGGLEGQRGWEQLRAYEQARSEFIRYTHNVRMRQPFALFPINYDDWLRNDPAFAAAYSAARQGNEGDPGTELSTYPPVVAGIGAARGNRRELLSDGAFGGGLRPGLRIAGLQYGADLPGGWQSKLEPAEHAVAELRPDMRHQDSGTRDARRLPDAPTVGEPQSVRRESSARRYLHLSGQENATVYQWQSASPSRLYSVSADVRGQVTSTAAVWLTIGWLDAQQRPIGKPRAIRLPGGAWPDWVTLRQGEIAPANAAWVGIAVRIQHQVAGDWVDFCDLSLQESGVAVRGE